MAGYAARDVAKLLRLSVGQVHAWVRAGFLAPEREPTGEQRFSFQDLVLLRTAKGLMEARIPARRVRRALEQLRRHLPRGRPLSGVQIAADGKRIVVRDGNAVWNPESGQTLFNFEVKDLAKQTAPLVRRAASEARTEQKRLRAADWYALGCDLEITSPQRARDAYRRTLELDPRHADAMVNLGRLLHEAGELRAAEAHYRLALGARPGDATAAFNLGVVLEDLGRASDAVHAYESAIAANPGAADAHYNLARLYERTGKRTAALRHLKTYRKLTLGR